MDRSCEFGRTVSAPQWMQTIREVGPEHFVLATDYGIRAACSPVQGMRTLIATLLDYEFTPDEIRTMTSINPARLIGLDE
jgi:adenine deaminase